MKTSPLTVLIPASIGLAGAVLLVLWTTVGPSSTFEFRAPGLDGTPPAAAGPEARPLEATGPVQGAGQPAQVPGSWPGFRGPRRDGICDDGTPLLRTLPASGLPVLWRLEVGEGYAGAAIRDGSVYVLDYDEQAEADTLRCLSLSDGRELWHNSYPVLVTPNHGMSRTIPALAQDMIVTIGPRCHVAGWDAATGQCRWLLDMVRQFGSEERQWYTGQCPLVDGDRVILAPCGRDCLLAALDLKTGAVIWKTPPVAGWKMSHACVMPMEWAGRKTYVYCGTGGTAGVAADEGRLLWKETSWVEHFATSPSPLPLPDGRVFLCSGYDTVGAMMLQLGEENGNISAKILYKLDRKQFNSEQQTPIYYQGQLYAVRKEGRGQLVCLDLDGKERWNSGKQKFGHGPYLIADGLVLALSGDGLLAAVEATPQAYRPLWEFQVFEQGNEAWGPMAIVAGRLVLRDLTRLACVDLRGQN